MEFLDLYPVASIINRENYCMAETNAVRPGEEIDVASLAAFLSSELRLDTAEINVEQFPAGSSNLTYLVHVGGTEYVLRRPPFGNTVKSAHDMHREFDVLSKLSKFYPPAPKPLLFASDESIIGSEFYLMERREGLIIRGNIPGTHTLGVPPLGGKPANNEPPKGGTSSSDGLETSQDFRLKVARSFIQNLADLHSLDYAKAGLENLGRAEGYNRRQVEGWTKRYFAAKTDEHTELESAITWLNANIPPESGASLIHNDYKFDNVMLDPADLTRVTAVLDWEMVTLGDPLMDLGTTLGYWMSADAGEEMMGATFNPRVLMENISRRDLVDMYAQAVGREIPDIIFYYTYGTFKIAAICQQIYARYVKGFTKDPRFAGFDKFVRALGQIAHHSIQVQRM